MPEARLSFRPLVVAILLLGLSVALLIQAGKSLRGKKRAPRSRQEHISIWADGASFPEKKQLYLAARADMLEKRRSSQCGGKLRLIGNELKANDYVIQLRDQLISDGKGGKKFPPAEYFFGVKTQIESTELFRILRAMPKGCVLHIHTSSTGRASWIVENAASRPNCYVFWEEDNDKYLKGQLRFYKPGREPPGFRPVRKVREEVADFDRQLLGLITLNEEDARSVDIWKRFEDIFTRLHGFMHYQPAFLDYYRDAFDLLLEDNIQYVELRAGLGTLYDLTGREWTPGETVQLFKQVRDEVRQKHPEFNLKLIASYYREANRQSVWENLERTIVLRRAHPNFVIGYDLVGEEDTGHATIYYLDDWLRLDTLEEKYGVDLPFYFHDGESDWPEDKNLYDAYLLGSSRIGHGIALFRSPHLEQELIQAGIALEVCPISNQVLHYVTDLRMHPATGYLARNIPCVISSDDPAIFGYTGLSYDFWETTVAWKLDLKVLKQLVLNSFKYSAMTSEEKDDAMEVWREKWDTFVDWVGAEAEKAESSDTAND